MTALGGDPGSAGEGGPEAVGGHPPEVVLLAVDQELQGHVIGSAVPADASGATAVPGVWVAGNVTDLRAQVMTSAAAGLSAAVAVNADLIAEYLREPVLVRRAGPFSAAVERELCEQVLGDRRHGI